METIPWSVLREPSEALQVPLPSPQYGQPCVTPTCSTYTIFPCLSSTHLHTLSHQLIKPWPIYSQKQGKRLGASSSLNSVLSALVLHFHLISTYKCPYQRPSGNQVLLTQGLPLPPCILSWTLDISPGSREDIWDLETCTTWPSCMSGHLFPFYSHTTNHTSLPWCPCWKSWLTIHKWVKLRHYIIHKSYFM